jgi:hypothetical protein
MVQMPGPAPVSVLLCKRSSTIAVHVADFGRDRSVELVVHLFFFWKELCALMLRPYRGKVWDPTPQRVSGYDSQRRCARDAA